MLKELADQYGYAILAPTYGTGNWNYDPDARVCRRLLEQIDSSPELDGETVFLSGLSNGGKGVSRAIPAHGPRFKGAIYISPVIELAPIQTIAYQMAVGDLPVLILHGEEDRRIPASILRRRAAIIEAHAASLDAHYVANEDHFLMFSKPGWLVKELANFMQANKETP